MNGMSISAQQQRIERACGIHRPRYHHKPTSKRYILISDIEGACELEGLDGRSTYALRESLDDNEIWERLP